VPLECRERERCQYCFIEPFCNTADRVIERQNQNSWEVWWVGAAQPTPGAYADLDAARLPYGSRYLGVAVAAIGFWLRRRDRNTYALLAVGAVFPLALALPVDLAERRDEVGGLAVHLGSRTDRVGHVVVLHLRERATLRGVRDQLAR